MPEKYFVLTPVLPYHCNVCDKSFSSKRCFHTHTCSNLQGGIYPYHCPLCKRGFTASVHLLQHVLRQHPGDSLPCHHCDMKFATIGPYTFHMKEKHGVGAGLTLAAMTTRADPKREIEDVPRGIDQVQTGPKKME